MYTRSIKAWPTDRTDKAGPRVGCRVTGHSGRQSRACRGARGWARRSDQSLVEAWIQVSQQTRSAGTQSVQANRPLRLAVLTLRTGPQRDESDALPQKRPSVPQKRPRSSAKDTPASLNAALDGQ